MPERIATHTFYYRAASPEGAVVGGTLPAANYAAAVHHLKRSGYRPLQVENKPPAVSFLQREIGAGTRRLGLVASRDFCRQIALFTSTGVNPAEALSIMASSFDARSRLGGFCRSVLQGLRLGRSLGAAIEESGYRVPPDLVPLVRSGETAGCMSSALGALAEGYESRRAFSRIIVGALAYPAFLLVAALVTVLVLAFFVAPSLHELFAALEQPEPMTIAVLAGLSATLISQPLLAAIPLVAMGASAVALGGSRLGRSYLRKVLLRIPILGRSMRWAGTYRFAVTLRLYVTSNITASVALPGAINAAGLADGPASARAVSGDIAKGMPIAEALARSTALPDEAIRLIRLGDTSGRLGEVLGAVAADAKSRFETSVLLMSSLLAPILILGVGSVAGTIIYAVFTALLRVNEVAL